MENYKLKLIEINEQESRQKKLIDLIEFHEKEVINLQKLREEAWNNLQKENKDVTKMERISLTSIISSIQNNRIDKLEKEQQEAMQAKIKYHQATQNYDQAIYMKNKYQKEYDNIGNVEEKKEALFDRISKTNLHVNHSIIKQCQELGKIKAQLKELYEAKEVGDKCLQQLEMMLKSSQSASGWSTFDMLGGGTFSSIMKHDKIDKAVSGIEELKRLTGLFNKELRDVNQVAMIELRQLSSFEATFDIFFDNFLFDMMIDSKINKMINQLEENKVSIEDILEQLQIKINQCNVDFKMIKKNITKEIII